MELKKNVSYKRMQKPNDAGEIIKQELRLKLSQRNHRIILQKVNQCGERWSLKVSVKKMNKTIGHNNTTTSNHIINNWLFWNIKF